MIQKWEIFCTECRRVMTFERTVDTSRRYRRPGVAGPPDAPWICSDTWNRQGRGPRTATGCGAEATFSANGFSIRKVV